jgi:molecular chaperone GrpE
MEQQERTQGQQNPPEQTAQGAAETRPDGAARDKTGGDGGAAVDDGIDQRLAAAEGKAAEMQDALLRARADVENMRRRAQDDVARAHKYAIEEFADSLVPVKESLEKALEVNAPSVESLKEGVDMTLKQLSSAFQRNRLFEINPPAGEKLDPTRHQAISMVPADQDANTIVNVLQKGYMIGDRLLRPALVTVSQEKAPDARP